MKAIEVRWRAVDPGEARDGAGSTEYTRVHYVVIEQATICGLVVPESPYVMDRGAWIPEAAPRCKRCVRRAQGAGIELIEEMEAVR